MNEEEWRLCADPRLMFEFLLHNGKRPFYVPPKVSPRKRALLHCAFCRAIWDHLPRAPFRDYVQLEERYAEELVSKKEMRTAWRVLYDQVHAAPGYRDANGWRSARIREAQRLVLNGGDLSLLSQVLLNLVESWASPALLPETVCDVLRCVIGSPNPFRPVAFSPAWRSTDVMLLASGIYAGKAFDRMPILADALQDAGCDCDALLTHLRDPNATHVRGCWALDLVLGKE